MEIDACKKRIDRYLASNDAQPLLINVQNGDDLDKILTLYDVGENIIVKASSFCNKDELPRIETLIAKIAAEKKNCFLVGLTSFLRFLGEEELKKYLSSFINMTIDGHLVVMTYQCEKLLNFSDPRLARRIFLYDGEIGIVPKLIFVSKELPTPAGECVVCGIENAVDKIETGGYTKVYVKTDKHKSLYEKSVYAISDMNKAYEVVLGKDSLLSSIDEACGSASQWEYMLKLMSEGKKFAEICNKEFGNYQSLEIAIPIYSSYPEDKKWLYFIALKLFGAKNNTCLAAAAQAAETYSTLIREVYRSILPISIDDKDFKTFYLQRKNLLNSFGNPIDEVIDFCKVVQQKEEKAIWYLTDNTRQEKELILILIEKYYQGVDKSVLEGVLKFVYVDLYLYIKDYRYDKPLLNKYFSLYTQCKVINMVLPELEALVNEQATLREYNLLLEPRTAKIDEIDKTNSQLYFIDALGVEYLSYILAKCKEKGLMAHISLCTANLPSITSKNKEFVSEFETRGIVVNSDKRLDDIKHHGTDDYDYRQKKQPTYLIEELSIIDDVIDKIKLKLAQGVFGKAIVVSDHGASRLAVIHETENMWEMESKGEHSGRCCPKTDADVQTPYATEEDGFWVLANYDRFRGGRKANVEVHGGATLEEVVVPIIEITRVPDDIEISVIDKVIMVSFRKKATIRLFSKTKLNNVTVLVDGTFYAAQEMDNNMYKVDMPQIKRAKKYTADVYSSNNLIASGLSFEVKKEGSQEKDLL